MTTTFLKTYLQIITIALFWCLIVIVTYLLLMEHSGALSGFPNMDKIIHATLFAILTAMGYLAYKNNSKRLYIGLLTYGAITECLQGLLTITRYASVYDWVADATGILLSVIVIKITKSYTMTKTTHVS